MTKRLIDVEHMVAILRAAKRQAPAVTFGGTCACGRCIRLPAPLADGRVALVRTCEDDAHSARACVVALPDDAGAAVRERGQAPRRFESMGEALAECLGDPRRYFGVTAVRREA